MYFSLFVLVALAASGHGSPDLCANTDVLEQHLLTAFSYERSWMQQAAKDQTFQYIVNIFNNLAFQTDVEAYEHSFKKMSDDHPPQRLPAVNAVLLVMGSRWGTDSDSISMMGAHYDSLRTSPGVCDNGAGMAALLEVARAVTTSTCTRLNTVIFVAFDWEEYYLSGSEAFVNHTLVPEILERFHIPADNFKGAYILDTVMDFDDTPQSQHFPDGFEKIFPDGIEKVKAHDFAGDFLASVGREDDRHLMDMLQKHWNSSADGKPDRFRVIDLDLPFSGRPSESEVSKYVKDLYRSDHYNFWNYKDEGNYTKVGLKAVFLTDTAEFRGYMQKCYHAECDDVSHITPLRMQFLAVMTNALTNSLLDMATEGSQCKC